MFWSLPLIGWLSLHHLVVFFSRALICSFIWAIYFFLSQCTCYIVRGGALGIQQGGVTHFSVFWHCMWGRGPRGNSAACSALYRLPVPSAKWALLVLIPVWVGLCPFQAPVGLSNELSCEAGSFSHCHLNPHRFEALRLYFPVLEPWVALDLSRSPVVPPSSSARECGTAHPGPPAAALLRILSTWLPVSAPLPVWWVSLL